MGAIWIDNIAGEAEIGAYDPVLGTVVACFERGRPVLEAFDAVCDAFDPVLDT